MKKIQILIAFLLVFAVYDAWAIGRQTMQEKTYYNEDGSYAVSKVTTGSGDNGQKGPGSFYFALYDKDGNCLKCGGGLDFNHIVYNKDAEVIESYNYYSARVTYVLNEEGKVVSLKSSWTGPVVETFEYTDSGKMLVFDSEGKMKGVYGSLLDYHLARHGDHDGYRADSTGLSKYLDQNLNQINEDGRFYDYDSQGNLIAIYDTDGSMEKYDKAGNLLKKIDSQGNIVWSKKIYTVQEAESVSRPTGNTIRIRYK